MRDRAWPGRVALDRMRSVRDSQSWLRDDAWSQRSRVGRMASWLIDAPPSPAARFSVRQALAYREP